MIAGTYNASLVALSVVIAIVASYAAFNLAERVSASGGQRRWAWLTSGAIAMGFAIWSMHYVGMLAFILPVQVLYHIPTVILSLIAAVPGAAIALYIVSRKTMYRTDIAVAGLCLGAAVVAMHYIGMAAMRSAAMHYYRLSLVILSVVVAVIFSSVAAWLAFRFGRSHQEFTWTKISGASLMGLGIASMHYTAMAAAYFGPGHTPPMQQTVEVSTLGAFGIGMTTLLLLGTVLVTLWWDRRLANERLLRRLYRELHDVINTVPALAWSALPDGNIDYVNQRWQQFTGLTPEGALGRNWEAILHPDDYAKFVARWRAALNNGQPMETEVRVRLADGEYRCLLVRNVPMRDDLGNIVKWYGTGLDIEDRKQAEGKLRATMAERGRLAAFREEIGIALSREEPLREILQKCGQAMVRHLDAAFARIWTLTSDGSELELQASSGMYTRLDGSHSRIPFGQMKIGLIAQERKPHLTNDVQNDPRVTDKDWARREKMISFAGYPLLVEDRVVGVMGMFSARLLTESTLEALSFAATGIAQGIERKKTEEALRRSQAYLAEAQRLTHTGSWVWRVEGRNAVYLSEEWYRVYGFDPTDGLPTWEKRLERIHPEDRARWEGTIERAILEKADYDVEFRIVLPDGTVKWIHTVGHPILTDVGDLVQFLGSSTDITERKRAEEARERLRQLEADLAHINRVTMMGEFAASVAHEIKQPIAAASTNARTCLRWLGREQPEITEAREAASRIVQDVTRASEIINRIRILFNKGEAQRENVDVNEVIREMISLLCNEAGRHAISIHTELAPEPLNVRADRVQLQQVFMNLILNGIDAINEADVEGDLTIKSQRYLDDQVLVSISDTGTGLPPERADKVFDAFFTTKPQGTGMGLSISRSIIESHGGRLWAAANSDRGATFQFTLPAEHAATAAA